MSSVKSPQEKKRLAYDRDHVSPAEYPLVHRMPGKDFEPTAAYRWLDVLLEASGRDAQRNSPRPTILSRTMALVLTAMYDAWAAYDEVAVGTRLGATLRRPAAERTQANKEKAIAYAAYRSLLFVYPDDAEWIRGQLRKQGFDPDDASADASTPQGVGTTAANAVSAVAEKRCDAMERESAASSGATANTGRSASTAATARRTASWRSALSVRTLIRRLRLRPDRWYIEAYT